MDTSIKLITLNIEGDRHLDRVIPFLQKENAHVVCLQEVLQSNVELLKKELQMFGEYEPTLAYKEPKDFKKYSKSGPLTGRFFCCFIV
jgi:exonuclease III